MIQLIISLIFYFKPFLLFLCQKHPPELITTFISVRRTTTTNIYRPAKLYDLVIEIRSIIVILY